METVRIKYLAEDMPKLEYVGGDKSDWIDLAIAEDVEMIAGEWYYIPLGVAIELPKGYEALVIPRSSTFKRYGLLQANSIALIDESYRGDNDEWRFPAYATRDISISKGTRVCQFRIIEHQPMLKFEEVETLGNASRGGYGSTGV